MFNIDFPLVHKLDQAANVIEFTIFHYDYGIFVGVSICQYGIKKCAACTQNHSMCAQCSSLAGQCYIAKRFTIQQLREHGLQIAVVILPPKTILLHCHFRIKLCRRQQRSAQHKAIRQANESTWNETKQKRNELFQLLKAYVVHIVFCSSAL